MAASRRIKRCFKQTYSPEKPLSRAEMRPFSPKAGVGADAAKCTQLVLAPTRG
jgi:hypothetical protein